MLRLAVIVLALALSPSVIADPSWQFIRVSHDLGGEPKWRTYSGTATVRIEKAKIRIDAFGDLGPNDPVLVLQGSIDKSGRIKATGTLMHTDAEPFKVQGKMRSWNEDQLWADKKKRVIYREITFPLDPHYEFYGFLSREVHDK